MRNLALALLLALVLAPAAHAAEGKPTVVEHEPMVVLMGSVTNAMWPIKDVAAMERSTAFARSLGVDAYETYVPWNVLEPSGPGAFDWTETDKLDGACRKAGLKWQAFVMMNPSYATPKWFREGGKDVAHRCLEHDKDSDARSIFCPGLEEHVDRVLGGLFKRYNASPALESVMFGVSGDFGESIYPAGAVGWNGQYHNHAGFWCAEEPARASFRAWAKRHYVSIAKLNAAWATRYAGFEQVTFQLPALPMPDARWLDQAEWYRGAMTEWCGAWMRVARKHADPRVPLYLCVGGGDHVMLGFDISGQARLCAKNNVWLRLTNEGSNYAGTFMGTRQVTTAAKLYGVPSGLEPAGEVNARGVTARIFGAAAAGCNHVHYYEGQVANFGAATPAEGRTTAWNAHRKHLVQKAPYVNVAAYYPRIDAMCKREMSTESLNRYASLRDAVDFDMVDDNLAADGKLDRYRVLLLGPVATLDARAYAQLTRWIRAGGTLVATEQKSLRVWNDATSTFRAVPPLAPKAAAWATIQVLVPARYVVRPGAPPPGVELTGTWSHSEGDYRWGGKNAGLKLPVDPKLDYTLTYEGGVPLEGAVLANGAEIGRMSGGSGNEHQWSFQVPATLLKGSNTLRLEFRMKPMVLATDSRELCIYPRAITLEAAGGDAGITEPRFGAVTLDRATLAASTVKMGKGRIVALPAAAYGPAEYARALALLLRSGRAAGIPPSAVPDGAGDGLFVALRGDEALVYNSTTQPVSATLTLPAGSELDRLHRSPGQTIEVRDLAPDAIVAHPLKVVAAPGVARTRKVRKP
jgi:hypothetical protein